MSDFECPSGTKSGHYWRDEHNLHKPVVDLGGVRCPRCPRAIRTVPTEKVSVIPYPDGEFLRTFVCPHCRGRAGGRIGSVEASRLVGAGAAFPSVAAPTAPLSEDDLIAFGSRAADESHLVRLALEA